MISIAMATYNGQLYIEKQLQSLLNQTMLPDEIIIYDDRSKDDTVLVIEKYLNDAQAKLLTSPEKNNYFYHWKYGACNIKLFVNDNNQGYIENFYRAIKGTKGDYVFLCDQDDIWNQDKIEKMIGYMTPEVSALCSYWTLIDEQDEVLEKQQGYYMNPFAGLATEMLTEIKFKDLIYGNVAQGCTYCFRGKVRDAYVELHSKELIHDHQIMFIASLLGKVYFIKESLIQYRIHQGNAIGYNQKESSQEQNVSKESMSKVNILKRVFHEPFMVTFMKQLHKVQCVPHRRWYYILYYLRIPHFVSRKRYKKEAMR